MAGPTVASAEVRLTFDGRGLVREAHTAGKNAARSFEAGAEDDFSKSFGKIGKKFESEMGKSGKAGGSNLSKGFSGAIRRMDGDVKVIIASILAGAGEIASLGPALGASLGVAAAGVSAIAVGVAAGVAGFKDLFGKIEDAPAEIQDVVSEFKDLGTVLGDVQDEIAKSTLSETRGAWKSIGETVSKLTPNLAKVGSTLGKIVTRFANAVKEGKGFQLIKDLIDDSVPVLDSMATAVGDLLLAIGDLAHESQPMLLDFLGYLDDVFLKLDAWVKGPGFDEWQSHAESVFTAVGGLFDALGQTLDDLVTDESVGRLTDFIDDIAEFLPTLGDILTTIGKLDIFGLIAEALVALGDALTPLIDPLGEFFEALNKIVGIAIDEWGDRLGGIAEVLAPFVDALAKMTADVDEDTIRAIADALLVLAASMVAIKLAGKVATGLTGLNTALGKFKLSKAAKTTAAISGLALVLGGGGDASSTMLGGAAIGAQFGIWGAAIGFLAGTITSFFTDSEGWKESLEKWNKTATTGITQIKDSLGPLGDAMDTFEKETWPNFIHGIAEIDWGESFGNGWDQISTFFGDMLTGVGTWFAEDFWPGVRDFFNTDWGAELDAAFPHLTAWLLQLMIDFGIWWNETFWPGVVTWWNDGWTAFPEKLNAGWEQISTWWEETKLGLSTWFTDIFWPGVVTWWNEGWAAVPAKLANGWDQIVVWWTAISTALSTWWTEIFWPGVVAEWNNGWAKAPPQFTAAWTAVSVWFTALSTTVSTWWSSTFWPGMVGWWNDGLSGWGNNLNNGWSQISGWFSDLWSDIRSWFSDLGANVGNWFNDAIGNLTGNISVSASASGGGGGGGAAAGRLVAGAQRILVGEAGPEAIVPLHRDLSRVDPSVRALSAIAQGKSRAGLAPTNLGKTINVQPGAIVVQSSLQPQNTAAAVLDRMVAKL